MRFDTVYTYQVIYDTVFQYDTVYIEEYERMPVIYTDGLKYSPFNNNDYFLRRDKDSLSLNDKRKWSSEIFTSGFGGSYSYITNDDSKNELLDLRETSFSPKLGYNVGVNINYHLNQKIYLQSGIGFSWFNEDMDFYSKRSIIDTIYTPYIETNMVPIIDTIAFLDVDALVLGDSVWVDYYDTILIPRDTVLYNQEYANKDTVSTRKGNYNFQYFEIPLIASYNFDWKMIRVSPKVGLITGLLYGYNRYEIYTDNEIFNSALQEEKELKAINISAYLSMSFEYQFDKHWSIIGEPWIKVPVTEFSESEGIVQKMRTQGMRVGLRYYF